MCRDYITEKLHQSIRFPWVPVVYGGGNYSKFLPKDAYIDARLYTPQELGRYLHTLADDPKEYLAFFKWKKGSKVLYRVRVELQGNLRLPNAFNFDLDAAMTFPLEKKQPFSTFRFWHRIFFQRQTFFFQSDISFKRVRL